MSEIKQLKQPLVSIVTVCLNSEGTIRETLESVRQQSYSNIEHIIIDGVSTDATLQIVDEFKKIISLIVSEKDNGIYDAMNKGLSKTRGGIIYFLNSDDILHDADVISDVVAAFETDIKPQLVYGDVIYKSSVFSERRHFDGITQRNLIYRDLCHQGVFARRELFESLGEFNLKYRIAADFDWLLKVFLSSTQVFYLDRVIAIFNSEGEHSQDLNAARKERLDVKLQYQSRHRYFFGNLIYRIVRKFRTVLGG